MKDHFPLVKIIEPTKYDLYFSPASQKKNHFLGVFLQFSCRNLGGGGGGEERKKENVSTKVRRLVHCCPKNRLHGQMHSWNSI